MSSNQPLQPFASTITDPVERLRLEHAALEAAANAIVITDLGGVIVWVNRAFSELTGYAVDQVLGQRSNLLKSGRHDAAFYRQMWDTILRGQVWRGEVINRYRDGQLHIEEMTITPVQNEQGQITHFVAIKQDITGRKQAEQSAKLDEIRLEAMLRLNQMTTASEQEIADYALDASVQITQSQIGYLAFMSDDESVLTMYAWSRTAMDECAVLDKPIVYPVVETGLWGEAVRQREPVITNDYAAPSSLKRGYPAGHVQVKRHMNIPVFDGERIVAVAGVGNKEGPYDQADVRQLTLLMEGMWQIIRRRRLEEQARESLERRGRQVQTGTEIAQEIASAQALDDLYRRVVILIKERFGYYHAQIFRYDPAIDALVLVVGYGEAGEKMLAARHHLKMGRGVVGAAAATGQPILAANVADDPDWRPNPHLPDTQGELAVPIKLRDQVLGILDVQSERAYALTQEDQLLLEGLCGQIAIAIENTRLRQDTEERLRELDATYRAISHEGWQAFRQMAQLPRGYLFQDAGLKPVQDLWTPQIGRSVERNSLIPATHDQPVAVAPISVRGEVVGAVGVYDNLEYPLSSDDLVLIEQISEQGALALESARLVEQTRSALAEAEALHQASQAIGKAQSVADILQAVTPVADLMGMNNVTIRVIAHQDDQGMPLAVNVDYINKREGRWVIQPSATNMPVLADAMIKSLFEPGFVLVYADAQDPNCAMPERIREGLKRAGSRGTLMTGLNVRGRTIGFISWSSPESLASIPERYIQIITRTLADQVAVALESRRLFEQTQVALAEAQVLYQGAAALTAAQTFEGVLDALRQHTLVGQADLNVSLNWFDTPWVGDEMPHWVTVLARWSRLPSDRVFNRYDLTQLPAARLLRLDEPLLIEDLEHDPRLDDRSRYLYCQVFGGKSTLFAPLVAGGQWMGYVNAIWGQMTHFDEALLRQMSVLGGQAAVTVQGIYQLQETQRRARREQILREITAHVRGSTDPDVIARAAARELGAALGRRTFVRLGSAEQLSQPPTPGDMTAQKGGE